VQLHVVSSDEPTTVAEAEAEANQNWKRAMEEEMSAIEDNKTKKLCQLPHGRRAIGLKWVFKVKHDQTGVVGNTLCYEEPNQHLNIAKQILIQ
jgi:hypothetical protein